MAGWLVVSAAVGVFVGIILLAFFALTHRMRRLTRRWVAGAADRYDSFVGMGGAA